MKEVETCFETLAECTHSLENCTDLIVSDEFPALGVCI